MLRRRRLAPLLTAFSLTATALADEPPARLPSVSPVSMVPSPDETPEAPPGAPAPPRENPWREHPLVLEVHGAPRGPLGFAGVALDYSINERFAVNAGVGAGRGPTGSSFGERLQYALSGRLRLPLSAALNPLQLAVGPEAGLSLGSFSSLWACLEGICPREAWSRVLWANTNAVFELRHGYFQARVFAGAAIPLASAATTSCTTSSGGGSSCTPAPSDNPPVNVNLGLALGLVLF